MNISTNKTSLREKILRISTEFALAIEDILDIDENGLLLHFETLSDAFNAEEVLSKCPDLVVTDRHDGIPRFRVDFKPAIRVRTQARASHPELNIRETAAVLAGLRLLQRGIELDYVSDVIRDIATDGGYFTVLSQTEIAALCERINCGDS